MHIERPAPSRATARAGFMLAPLLYMLALGGIGASVLFSSLGQILRSNVEVTAATTARQQLNAAGQTLSASSVLDAATSTIVQPPGAALFASITDTARLPGDYATIHSSGAPTTYGVIDTAAGVRQLDPWGKYYLYCRWENAVSTPAAPSFMVMTGGPDGQIATRCGDAMAQGDDRVVRLTVAEAINRANVWRVNSSSQVTYGMAGSSVKVNDNGAMEAASLTLATPMAVTSGGTGAASVAGARSSLGVPDYAGTGASGTWGIAITGNAATSTRLLNARTISVAGATGLTAPTQAFDGSANVALVLSGTLALASGGTGATTATQALSNLGGTVVGRSLFTAVNQAAARAGLGAGLVGDSLVTAASAAAARTTLELGTMAVQNADTVAITGGTIAGVNLSGSTIPASGVVGTMPAAGSPGQIQFNNAGSFGGAAGIMHAASGTLLALVAQAAADTPLIVKGASAQSASLLEIQNSAGSPLLGVTAAGAVGIGTGAPAYRFVVQDIGNTSEMAIKNNSDSSDIRSSTLTFAHNTGPSARIQASRQAGDTQGMNLKFYTEPTTGGGMLERVRITPDGKVGIGTLVPAGKLSVSSVRAMNGGLTITDSGDADNIRAELRASINGHGLLYLYDTLSATPTIQLHGNGAVFFNQPGNVGIGTTTPAAKLDVVGAVATTGGVTITRSTADAQALVFSNTDGNDWFMVAGGGRLRFHELTPTNAERMTILAGGNVGIGTTNPVGRLTVSSTRSANTGLTITDRGDGDAVRVDLRASTNGYGLLYLYDTVNPTPTIQLHANGDVLLNQPGNVGIGTATPSYTLHVNGTAYATGAAGALSDRRHKTAIASLADGALALVGKLRAVSFLWKDPHDAGMTGEQLGFIAQEVEAVLPHVVLTEANAEQTKSMKYTEIIPVLVKAMQEQQALVAAQAERIARLEARTRAGAGGGR